MGICLRCGAGKRAANLGCGECGHEPLDSQDRVRHLFAALEWTEEQRSAAAASIASGAQPHFDEEAVRTFEKEIEAIGEPSGVYLSLLLGVPVVLLAVLIGLLLSIR